MHYKPARWLVPRPNHPPVSRSSYRHTPSELRAPSVWLKTTRPRVKLRLRRQFMREPCQEATESYWIVIHTANACHSPVPPAAIVLLEVGNALSQAAYSSRWGRPALWRKALRCAPDGGLGSGWARHQSHAPGAHLAAEGRGHGHTSARARCGERSF
jgi:hypothetical protein